MTWTIEQNFRVKMYYKTKTFNSVRARYKRKLNFNTYPNRRKIFKLVKNFEACEDRRATVSSQSGPPITLKKCTHFINNFARRIRQCLDQNVGQLEDVF